MPLQALRAPPTYMSVEEHSVLQQSTPSSFDGHAPVLRLKLEDVRCTIEPTSSLLDSQTQSGSNGTAHTSLASGPGQLWVTEGALSFLSHTGQGFTLDYPTLSLHAVSRTLPESLLASSSSSHPSADLACLYCQLDTSQDLQAADEGEDEGESGLSELWLLPANQDSLEPLFEALSYCASLHPSVLEDDEEGHPFSSMGPFGTGAPSQTDGEEAGAYDDAEEEGEQGLSEAGRATLAHLDSLIAWPPTQDLPSNPAASSPPASFHSSDPRSKTDRQNDSDTLILVNLPQEVFQMPELASSLLDLLHAYGDMVRWTPLPSFGRALVQYKKVAGAVSAKEALDKLLLPIIDEGDEEGETELDAEPAKRSPSSGSDLPALRVYFGPHSSTLRMEGNESLPVPATDRNFLISPPGSPPVGWEPVREDPPNTDTLADDLIKALGSLRDRGLGVESHSPRPLQNDDFSIVDDKNTNSQKILPPPSLVIPPSTAPARSAHPLASRGAEDDECGFVSIPGVTVQSVDPEKDDDDGKNLNQRLNKGLSITGVKATVESMRGAAVGGLGASSDAVAGGGSRITPTGRPPLA